MMSLKTGGYVIVFLAVAILTAACKHLTDDLEPDIRVIAPVAGSSWNEGDTMRIEATFSDDRQLVSVQVTLTDQDNQPVLPAITSNPVNSGFKLNADYLLDNPELASGIYQLHFQAFDGTNTRNVFSAVNYYAASRQLLYPVVITHSAQNGTGIYYKNTYTWNLTHSYTDSYIASDINCPAKQLYCCTAFPGCLQALHLPDGNVLWKIDSKQLPVGRYFETISFRYPLLYISYFEKGLKGCNAAGNEIYAAQQPNGSYAHAISTTNNTVVTAQTDLFDRQDYLSVFHKTGGKLLHYKYLESKIQSIFHLGFDKVLVVGSKSGNSFLGIYDGSENVYTTLKILNNETILHAAQMERNIYALSTFSKLYMYRSDMNSMIPIANVSNISALACDNLQSNIYCATGKKLKIYKVPEGTLVDESLLPDTVAAIHLMFNK